MSQEVKAGVPWLIAVLVVVGVKAVERVER